MKFYGIEKLSLVDFDGYVSATIFTGTCNFRCPFCHNGPLVTEVNKLDTLEEEYILSFLESRKNLLEGLCVTGGEPTMHKELPAFLEKVKKIGYKTKLDTNGTNVDMVKTLNENGLCDYFAMDIKNSKEKYAKTIGIENFDTAKIQDTIDYFLTSNCDYEFRTTLMREFHTEKDIIEIAKWIKGAKKYFFQKYKDSETCIEHNLSPIDDKTVLEFVKIVKPYIPNVKTRGYDL